MSYAVGAALQQAVFECLRSDAVVSGLVGASIFDALPVGERPDTYVVLGEETVRDMSDGSAQGAMHRFLISVVTVTAGYGHIKLVAAAIGDALFNADMALNRGRIVNLSFERATAKRSGKAGRMRRIDLRFRACVEDT